MSTQYTSPYSLPWPQSGDPVREGAAAIEGIAKRVNQVLLEGTFPAATPEILALTTRLTDLEKPRRASFTGTSISYPNSSAQWGVGILVPDTSATQTMNNDFVVAHTSDTLKITKAGIYLFEWNLFTTSLPPNGEMGIKNVTTGELFSNDDLKRTVTWTPTLNGTSYAAVNDVIQFYTFNRSGAFVGSNRVKVTKIG